MIPAFYLLINIFLCWKVVVFLIGLIDNIFDFLSKDSCFNAMFRGYTVENREVKFVNYLTGG
jgi:hypothetical protein